MNEEFYLVLIDGRLSKKDGATIRRYKTRERAIREHKWEIERGWKVEVGRLALVDVEEATHEDIN